MGASRRAPEKRLVSHECRACARPFTAGKCATLCPSCRYLPGNRRGFKREKYPTTPAVDDYIRQHYDPAQRRKAEEIAQAIGWPSWKVRKRASILGLARIRPTDWTVEEETFLLENVGTRTIHWIAKRLPGRTLTGVAVKIKHMRISRRVSDGYNASSLAECFGVNPSTVLRWIRSGKLHARRLETMNDENQPWHITDEAVVKFLRTYPREFPLHKVDQVWFMDLVLGGGLLRLPKSRAGEM